MDASMFDLCLFDLDNTLLRTDDLNEIRLRGVAEKDDPAYRAELLRQIGSPSERYIYTPAHLADLKARWPKMKFGIFTRSPYAYAQALNNLAYPSFPWDAAVTYENTPKGFHKPNGWGINECMRRVGIDEPRRVVMVGDEAVDVKAAYHAGAWVVLDKSSWPHMSWDGRKHWGALELIPDAIITGPDELALVLSDIEAYAPHLEWELNESLDDSHQARFSSNNHFYPREVGEPEKAMEKINSAGRHFSEYASLDNRRAWHALTKSIHLHKESSSFPVHWCNTVYAFVRKSFPLLSFASQSITIAAIPARPGRVPRMQHFIEQLRDYFQARRALGRTHSAIQFSTNLLSYAAGVRSQSGEHLNRIERFENVRDHLVVTDPESVRGRNFVIIDDVCTSGATLMYAKKRLMQAGALDVQLLALSKNVSEIL